MVTEFLSGHGLAVETIRGLSFGTIIMIIVLPVLEIDAAGAQPYEFMQDLLEISDGLPET
jgi:hypothetical protein